MKINISKEEGVSLNSATWSVEKYRLTITQPKYYKVGLEIFRYPSNCSAVILAGLHNVFYYGTTKTDDFPNMATNRRVELRFKAIVKRLFDKGVADTKDSRDERDRLTHMGMDVGVSHIQTTVNQKSYKDILEKVGFKIVNQYRSLSSGQTLYVMAIVNPQCSAETVDDGSEETFGMSTTLNF